MRHPRKAHSKCQPPASTFRLLSLPDDILLHIFEHLPNLYSVVALRLTCTRLDALFCKYPSTLKSQRDQITLPLLDYYQILPHIPPGSIIHVKDTTLECSDYTMKILQKMPHIQPLHHTRGYDIFGNTVVPDLQATEDDYTYELMASLTQDKLDSRHIIPLDYYCSVLLDTMKAEVWYASYADDPRKWRHKCMPAAQFFNHQRQKILDLHFIPRFGRGSIIALQVGSPLRSWLSRRQHDRLLAIFLKNGWPNDFKREEALAELETFWQTNRIRKFNTTVSPESPIV